jgi:predicted Zn-dependent peptidase
MYHRQILPNGLRVVCEQVTHVRSVAIGFWVLCGSRNETRREQGITHLLEHMAFKGTSKRSAREIAGVIDSVGGHLNAYTTKEYTCFYVKVLDRHFQLGMELLSDLVLNALLAPEELEKERNVVLEEIKAYEDSPDEQVFDLLTQTILNSHPLGHSILGTPETIRNLTREDLLAYKERFYTPGNSCLAVAGNVDPEEVIAAASEYWGKFHGQTAGEEKIPVKIKGENILKSKRTEQVHLCVGTPGFPRDHEDRYILMVLDNILGGSVSSRLFQELREERGLVYATGSHYAAFMDTGLFTVYAGTSLENFTEVLKVIRGQFEDLKNGPLSEEEVQRAKEQIKGNFWLSMENSTNRMSRLAKSDLFYKKIITPEEVVARIDQVTAGEVLRVARTLFQDDFLTLTAIGPFPPDYALERW